MREEHWKELFISINHLLKKLADAVSHWAAAQSSAPTPQRSPALNARTGFTPVNIADAVAELSRPSGDDGLDHVHEMTIDCLQRGYLHAVRDPESSKLRFALTLEGKDYVKRMLGRDNGYT